MNGKQVMNTGEIIDAMVWMEHGESDAGTQQLFRQNLQVLVELAKLEQRQEYETYGAVYEPQRVTGMLH